MIFFFKPRNEIVEGLYSHCSLSVCVRLCVCVFGSACEHNASRTDAPISMQFLLNGCLLHWLEPYGNW